MLEDGTIQINARGLRWFSNLSSDDYLAPGYFDGTANANSPYRWDYYRCRAEGHNTLVINPGSGPDRVVTGVPAVLNYQSSAYGDESFSVLDMTPTISGATRVNRGIRLFNNRKQVLVQDEIVMPSASTVWWFAHYSTASTTVSIAADGKSATMTQGTERLWLKILGQRNLHGHDRDAASHVAGESLQRPEHRLPETRDPVDERHQLHTGGLVRAARTRRCRAHRDADSHRAEHVDFVHGKQRAQSHSRNREFGNIDHRRGPARLRQRRLDLSAVDDLRRRKSTGRHRHASARTATPRVSPSRREPRARSVSLLLRRTKAASPATAAPSSWA